MFNASQLEIIRALVRTMREDGYAQYIAYSNNTGSGYASASPDLYIVFSKGQILANTAYSYSVPADSVRFTCYTSNSSAASAQRISSSVFGGALTVEPIEHIYTNARFESYSLQPDILWGQRYDEVSISCAQGVLLAVILFLICFFSLFKK